MKYLKFLKRYYSLYTNIRFKMPRYSFFQWSCILICFLQYTSFSINYTGILRFSYNNTNPDLVSHIQCFFALVPWIFGTKSMIFDSLIFFILNFFSLIILEIGVWYINKYQRCPLACLKFVRIYQSYFCPIFEYPLFYRVLYLIQLVYSSNFGTVTLKILTWISLVISILNVLMLLIHLYLFSIFLAPIDFIPMSLLDVYDGKSNIFFFLFRLIINLSSFFIYVATDTIYIVLVSILLFIFFSIIFYMRVMTVLHVSIVGAYFELSPFFSFPFEILLQSNYYKKWSLIFLLIVGSHVVFIIILKIVYYFVKKETLKIFGVLIRRNEEEEVEAESEGSHSNEAEIPSFASGNVVSGLRIMSSYYGDPQFFTRFALIQHRSGVRASSMLEIIRFLAIFPSKRIEMLKELKSLKSNSNYNRFMIHFFTQVLYSLVNPCSKKNKEILDFYQKSFIIHNHFFWVARNSKKFFVSFVEACATTYYFNEFKSEIQMLISRFPFDHSLYRRFGDFLLLACGDYENSIFYKKFADSIENKEINLTDTLIHRYVNVNPRILRYLNEEEYKSSSVNDQTIVHTFKTYFYNSTYKTSTSNTKRRRKTDLSANSTINENINTESINSELNSFSIDNANNSTASFLMNNSFLQNDSNPINNNSDELSLEKPVASFVRISNRCIPFFPYINNVIVSLLILAFLFQIIPRENKVLNSFSAISIKKPQILRLFVDAGNSIMFPFSLAYQEDVNLRSPHEYNQFKSKLKLKFVDLNGLFNSNFPENGFYSQIGRILNENVSTLYMNSSGFEINYKVKEKEDIIQPKKENFKIKLKSGNDTLKCQLEYSMMLENVIDFFTVISQIKNLTELMVLNISKSVRLINEKNYSMCDILQLLYDDMFDFPIKSMSSLEKKLLEVIGDFENLYDDIDLSDFTLLHLTVYIVIMMCFIALYSLLMVLHVNLIMKGQDKAISFLSSRERLECLLCQKTEESWDVLTLFIPPENAQSLNLREYSDVVELIKNNDSSDELELISNMKQNRESESGKSSEFEEKYDENETEISEDVARLFSLSAPFISELGQNLLLSSHRNSKASCLSDMSVTSSSSSFNGQTSNESVVQSSKDESEDENEEDDKDSKFDRQNLEIIINQALNEIGQNTKASWLHVFLFLISPWIIMAVSMCLIVYPVFSHTEMERELARAAVSEGRQIFACFELVQATSDYLYEKRKNVTKFRCIHSILSSWPEKETALTSYSSQISEYYFREQCMQLLGITCTSIATLVQEIIDSDVDAGRLTFLFLPAFIRFGQTVLEDLFFSESDYVEEISMISESSFILILCSLALCYLVTSFRTACVDMVDGFNSLFHFADKRLFEDVKKNELKNDITSPYFNEDEDDVNRVMWSIYHKEADEKLPSIVIFIASLIKNDEIYSISDNVKTIFNRPSTSFIGQKLNECFPIVPENSQLRQFFMPDLTKLVFHSSTTTDQNGWLNLTFMIENDHFQSKKSYKEDTIVEKLMHFVPTFFAKSFATSTSSVQKFEYSNPIVVLLRFDSSLQAPTLEQYFSIVNGAVMNFTSIKAILADGCVFVFTAVKKVNPVIPFLFARDLIEESKKPKRGKPTNGTVSILIEKIDSIQAEINQDDLEPFLETSIEKVDLKLKEKILFLMERDHIGFESDFEQMLPGITKDKNMDIKINDDDKFVFFSFEKFLSNLNCLM